MRTRLIALLLMLALPLQALAGTLMPLDRLATDASEAAVACEHCPGNDGATAPSVPAGKTACDQCAFCHLSTAGAILTASAGALALLGGIAPIAQADRIPASHPPPTCRPHPHRLLFPPALDAGAPGKPRPAAMRRRPCQGAK